MTCQHSQAGEHFNKASYLLQEFYQTNYKRILSYLYKRVKNLQDAEDIMQDAFFSCLKSCDAYDPAKGSIGTLYYVVVQNALKNYWRDSKISDFFQDLFENEPFYGDEINRAISLQSMRDSLTMTLKQLTEQQRKIIIYHYFYGLDFKKIAKILNTTSGSCRVASSRGLHKMRSILEHVDDCF